MSAMRWVLVVLIALYGVLELVGCGATVAIRFGQLHNPQIEPFAAGLTWPQIALWASEPVLSFMGALLLARRDPRSLIATGLAVAATVASLLINQAMPVYDQ